MLGKSMTVAYFGPRLRVTDNGHGKRLELLLDAKQHRHFLQHSPRQDFDWKTASASSLISNHLRKARRKIQEKNQNDEVIPQLEVPVPKNDADVAAPLPHVTADIFYQDLNASLLGDGDGGGEEKAKKTPLSLKATTETFITIMEQGAAACADLERFINNPSLDKAPKEAVDDLENAVRDYQERMLTGPNSIIKQLRQLNDTKEAKERWDTIEEEMLEGMSTFTDNMSRLKSKKLITPEDLNELFSSQERLSRIKALGTFVNNQMLTFLRGGISEAYDLTRHRTGNRFRQLFGVEPIVMGLSNAKAGIELRSSLYGVRTVNTHDPIPAEMLKEVKDAAGDTKAEAKDEPKWLALDSYMSSHSPEELDRILCELRGIPLQGESPGFLDRCRRFLDRCGDFFNKIADAESFSAACGIFFKGVAKSAAVLALIGLIANVTELVFHFPLRIAFSVALFAIRVVFTILSPLSLFFGIGPKREDSWLATIRHKLSQVLKHIGAASKSADSALAALHHKFSPVRVLKNYINGKHEWQCKKELTGDALTPYQNAIDDFTGQASSLYNDLITEHFSSDKMAHSLWDSGKQILTDLFNWFREGSYILRRICNRAECDKVFDDHVAKSEEVLRNKIQAALQQTVTMSGAIGSSAEAKKSGAEQDAKSPAEDKSHANAKHWGVSSPWRPNHYSSVLDFPDDFVFGLCDIVVDPMFRASPGLATGYFMLSMASFGALLAPGMVSGTSLAWLNSLPTWISQNFTGKAVTEGIAAKVIAVFVQWKLGFFTTEFALQLLHNDMDFFKEMFQEPEKITLGMVTLIGMGIGLGYVPDLPEHITIGGHEYPNPLVMAINIFKEESAECSHAGTPPYTAVEYMFLGLKFGFLVHELLAGAHHASANRLDFKKLMADLHAQGIKQVPDLEARKNIVQDALAKQGFVPQDDKDSSYNHFVNSFAKNITEAVTHGPKLPEGSAVAATDVKGLVDIYMQGLLANEQEEKQPADSKIPKPVYDAGQKLKVLIAKVNRMEIVGKSKEEESTFSHTDARLIYDKLDAAFEAYNRACVANECKDKRIPKEDYLHAYYNKHCYEGSNTLFKIITMPLAWVLQLLFKLPFALCVSPCMVYEIKKSFCEDLAMIIQAVALTARVLRAMTRALVDSFRPIIGFFAALIGLKEGSNALRWADNETSKLSFHRLNHPTRPLKAIYAEVTRIAGTNDNVAGQSERVLQQLIQHGVISGKEGTIKPSVTAEVATGPAVSGAPEADDDVTHDMARVLSHEGSFTTRSMSNLSKLTATGDATRAHNGALGPRSMTDLGKLAAAGRAPLLGDARVPSYGTLSS